MPIGKNTLSFKKQSFQSDTNIGLGFKDIICADQMVGGETYIDLTSLTAPTSMTSKGFTNPLAAEILDAKILFYKENVSVIRSAGGLLIPYEEYQIVSSSRINLTTPALVNEIFTIVIRNKSSNGMLGVDGRVIRATGVLAAGSATINVGQEFAINAYPAAQIGEVMLFIDGQIQFRNTGNSSTVLDGNYYEQAVTGGLGSIIMMNGTELYDRNWLVVGTAVIVQRPEGSRDSALETLAGQVDAIIPTLADLAGVDETVFQAAPNDVNLKQFGDTVIAHTAELADHESRVTVLENKTPYIGQTTWNPSDLVGTATVPPSWGDIVLNSNYFTPSFSTGVFTLTFNQSTLYRVTIKTAHAHAAAYTACRIRYNLGGTASRLIDPIQNYLVGVPSPTNSGGFADSVLFVRATAGQTLTVSLFVELTGTAPTTSHTFQSYVSAEMVAK